MNFSEWVIFQNSIVSGSFETDVYWGVSFKCLLFGLSLNLLMAHSLIKHLPSYLDHKIVLKINREHIWKQFHILKHQASLLLFSFLLEDSTQSF